MWVLHVFGDVQGACGLPPGLKRTLSNLHTLHFSMPENAMLWTLESSSSELVGDECPVVSVIYHDDWTAMLELMVVL